MNKPTARRSRPPAKKSTSPTIVAAAALIPEEQVWLANKGSRQTRDSYQRAIRSFVSFAGLTTSEDFAAVSPAAVIAWREQLTKEELAPRSIAARLSALSSLFKHLINHTDLNRNPVRDVERPKFSQDVGETKALTPTQARKLLDSPPENTLGGLRDRAMLAVGFMAGPRRAEIAALRVKDFGELEGYPALYLRRKGGRTGWIAIHQHAARRIQEYLDRAGHAEDLTAPLFRATRQNQVTNNDRRHLTPRQIDRTFKRWCRKVGLDERQYSSHSMRTTCATHALRNGASLEEVQTLLGHAKPSTTKLYDRRKYNPDRSASFFATY